MTDSRVKALEAARRLLDLCKSRDDAPSWMDIETVALRAQTKEPGIENDEIARQSAQWLLDAYAGMDVNTLRPAEKHGLIVAWENMRLRREAGK
jgi:hypothetical protein